MKIYTDGGSRGNPGPSACSFVAYEGENIIYKFSKFLGIQTNNYSEYQAVLNAVNWLKSKETAFFFSDSELMVKQLNGIYKIKDQNLQKLAFEIKSEIKNKNLNVSFTHILRNNNKIADFLVNQKLDENTS